MPFLLPNQQHHSPVMYYATNLWTPAAADREPTLETPTWSAVFQRQTALHAAASRIRRLSQTPTEQLRTHGSDLQHDHSITVSVHGSSSRICSAPTAVRTRVHYSTKIAVRHSQMSEIKCFQFLSKSCSRGFTKYLKKLPTYSDDIFWRGRVWPMDKLVTFCW